MQNPSDLTEEEQAVLALLRKGATNLEIAHGLSIKRSQASSLTDRLVRKLGANTRDDLLDPRRIPALVSTHPAPPIESRLIQEAIRASSRESEIDWKSAYDESRTGALLASYWYPVTVVLAVAAAILTILQLYFAVIPAVAAAGTAVLMIRDMRGVRLIIEGKVCEKSAKTWSWSWSWSDDYVGGREEVVLQVLIQREFTLNAEGELLLRNTLPETLRSFSVGSSVYDHYDRDDIIVLLCLPSGQILSDL